MYSYFKPLPFFDFFHFPGDNILSRHAIFPFVDIPNQVPPSLPGCISTPIENNSFTFTLLYLVFLFIELNNS